MNNFARGVTSILGALFLASSASAANFYVETVPAPISRVAPEVAQALATHHFKVVLHLDILKRIEAKEKVLHLPDLNRGKFTDVQAFVFCNPIFFSRLLNSHWKSASVCPLDLTVYGKDGSTTIVYPERTAYTQNTPANETAKQIDTAVVSALKSIPGAK
ncbi:DUF302 domain-containing protein [Acidithiobacillus sp. AMEEHan]|uniref:DUF302 domain-containing protein n=1 Tax=Acidithiobacillus sp. AMEEHan TaxID=2994951 RepID=UPI0027E3C85B|nr:DUF302 domain-containing protein [Acidithiobacillus sp. AMEEHan]